jgi:mono/diheme cytochrome c family protein
MKPWLPKSSRRFVLVALLAACGPDVTPEQKAEAVAAFTTVQQVFQHPRCQNCHIPGDAPLQYDAGVPHAMAVMRGPEGHGVAGL